MFVFGDPHRNYSIVARDDAFQVIAEYLFMRAKDASADTKLTRREETARLFALVGEYGYDDTAVFVVTITVNDLLAGALPTGLKIEVRTRSWQSKDDGGTDAEFWLVRMPDPDLD